MKKNMSAFLGEVTFEDMEKEIKKLEKKGYTEVKVVACHYWKGKK